MKIRRAFRWMSLVLLPLFAPCAEAQSPPPVFVSFDSHPFGPGDRNMTGKIKLQSGENTGNIEAWVVYADSREAVVSGQLGGNVPHGRAKTGVVDSAGAMTVTFIFPHLDHPTPNAVDRHPQQYRSGKKLSYKWVKKKGTTQAASHIVEFRMPDPLTIVNFGDSYASGEGAPYSSGKKWGSSGDQCHRSGNSGQAKAVKAYKKGHAETAIAFLNVACSGAKVLDGITRSQEKRGFLEDEDFPPGVVKPQYKQAKEWLEKNHYEQLNIAIVSIGGNDIGFGPLVTKFLIMPGNLADQNDAGARSARKTVARKIRENIPANYDELRNRFDEHFDYDRVLVTAYPDPTRDKQGQPCGKPFTIYGVCWGPVEALNNQDEFKFAVAGILTPMNNTIKEKVRSFPRWVFLDGTVAKAQQHGLCNCDVPYFNTIGASLAEQQDPSGTMHPNRLGHEKIYLPVVRDALKMEIAKIRIEYARERAKEIAKERARRKSEMAAAQSRVRQSQVTARPVVESTAKISADVLQKARETASKIRRVEGVRDEPQADDHEK